MRSLDAVAVVVPARDEEELLPGCLDAVAAAIDELRRERPGVPLRTFVVLDACHDGSASVVASRSGTTAVTVDAGCVGVARAAGVRAAAEWAAGEGSTALWVAGTDADSVVPPHWLTTQVDLAGRGIELVVGTVEPRATDVHPEVVAAWRARHTLADGHEHVHGANLGFSLHAYDAVGGFAPLPTHEDVDLVRSIRASGRTWVASGSIPVTTSGRRVARAPGGFARYLDGLGA